MFETRIACLPDKESIREIYLSAIDSAPALDEAYWDHLIEEGCLIVALEVDQVVGFGGIDVNATEQLKWLYILPQYQGAGVGSAILQQLEGVGWKAGLKKLRLHAAPAAVEFYRRHGYETVAPAEQIGHDHEGVEMFKWLGDAR